MPQRDANGQFVKGNTVANGNKGGPGRPPRPIEEKYRKWLLARVKKKDWDVIVDVAKAQAKSGDRHARQWLSDWCLGKPVERIAPTDPTGQYEYLGISDEDRIERLMAIFDAARARRGRQDSE